MDFEMFLDLMMQQGRLGASADMIPWIGAIKTRMKHLMHMLGDAHVVESLAGPEKEKALQALPHQTETELLCHVAAELHVQSIFKTLSQRLPASSHIRAGPHHVSVEYFRQH